MKRDVNAPVKVPMGPFCGVDVAIALTHDAAKRAMKAHGVDAYDAFTSDCFAENDWYGLTMHNKRKYSVIVCLNVERFIREQRLSRYVIGLIAHEVSHATKRIAEILGERDGFSHEANANLHEQLAYYCVAAIEEARIPVKWLTKITASK